MTDIAESKNSTFENEIIHNYYVEEDFDYFGHLDSVTLSTISWKRVSEISNDPCLLESHDNYIDGYIICGSQSVKWFPVLYTMLRRNNLINQVVKDIKIQDNYNRITYNGAFVFTFFGRNQWTNVQIDDRLPFALNSTKNLFSVSSNKEEYLPSLLEKAYARYLGGYGKVLTTDFIEAIMHFTGGVIQHVSVRSGTELMSYQDQKSLFHTIRSLPIDTLTLCHTPHDSVVTGDNILPVDHYYLMKRCTSLPVKSRSNVVMSVLSSMVDFNNSMDTADLIRLHNPVITGDWGGAYNIGSQEWESMSDNVRRHYNLTFEHEFEFWISMNDVCKNMSSIIFCHIPNDSRVDALLKSVSMWHVFYESGSYGLEVPHGDIDCLGNDFLRNDQYLIDATAVKQSSMKAVLQVESIDKTVPFNDVFGMIILKVENNRCYRLHDVLNSHPVSINPLSSTINTLSVALNISHGRYVLLPWRNGNVDINYYVRLYFTERSVTIVKLSEDRPPFIDCFKCSLMKTMRRAKYGIMTTFSKDTVTDEGFKQQRNCTSCISVNPADAVRLTIIGAEQLERKFNQKRSNSYFILKCGSYCYKSSVRTVTNSPVWNEDFIFYRVDPTKDVISIELFYVETFGFDKSLGSHCFTQYDVSRAQSEDIIITLSIFHDKQLVPTSSKIRVRIKSYLPAQFNNI